MFPGVRLLAGVCHSSFQENCRIRQASKSAFTFDISDTAVATIVGRTVTLRGDGESVITAGQTAAGSFSSATVTLHLRVQVRPDPASDATVVGLLQAQADASVRFASAAAGQHPRPAAAGACGQRYVVEHVVAGLPGRAWCRPVRATG